jgi:hypothetical protein
LTIDSKVSKLANLLLLNLEVKRLSFSPFYIPHFKKHHFIPFFSFGMTRTLFGVKPLPNPFLLKQPYRGNGTNCPKTTIRTRRTTRFAWRKQAATGIGLERCTCHSGCIEEYKTTTCHPGITTQKLR